MKNTYFVLLASLALITFSKPASSAVYPAYQGTDLCTRMVGFITGRSYSVVYPNCTVTLSLSQESRDWTGSLYGSYTFSLTRSDNGQHYATYDGKYQINSLNGKIYLGGNSYPQPGGSYAFGTVHASSISLATGSRGATRLDAIQPAIDPVFPR